MKNFSLLTQAPVTRLGPCYDLLNSTLVMGKQIPEELALPLRGKKRKLKAADLLGYYALKVLALRPAVVESVLRELAAGLVHWSDLISRSFLTRELQQAYQALVQERSRRLGLALLELVPAEWEVLERTTSLARGSGGHPGFWKAVLQQRAGARLSLTAEQVQQVGERTTCSGGWQSAYRVLAERLAEST